MHKNQRNQPELCAVRLFHLLSRCGPQSPGEDESAFLEARVGNEYPRQILHGIAQSWHIERGTPDLSGAEGLQ